MLSEYNEALHIATEKKISYDEGFEAGIKQSQRDIEQGHKRAAKTLIDLCQETGLDKSKTLLKLCDGLNIEQSVAQTLIEEYWKSNL